MEEEESSMTFNATKLNVTENSDFGYIDLMFRASKRSRHENNSASSARFKGVVPQQNGHWGAQIYANHQRIWLGTFKSEKEAAMAYDSAAIKLRSGDSHRNFPWTDYTIQEPNFQNLYTTEDILNMIRDGSYEAKLANFVKILSKTDGKSRTCLNKNLIYGDKQFSCTQLFQKELTPSDVGKLNRLVIPKKYAVKYFPYICEIDQQSLVGGGNGSAIDGSVDRGTEDIELVFYDKLMTTWKFRYCYWRSSQSFVFTRGWNRFVKEKKLREKDIIAFYTCEYPAGHGGQTAQTFFRIDVIYNHGDQEISNCINDEVKNQTTQVFNRLESSSSSPQHQHDHENLHVGLELELNLGKNKFYCTLDNITTGFNIEDKALNELKSSQSVEAKRITLFGVHIN